MSLFDLLLSLVGSGLALVIAVYPAIVSTSDAKHRRRFKLMGIASAIIIIVSLLRNSQTIRRTAQENLEAAVKREQTLWYLRNLQQDQGNLQQVAQNLMARLDSLTSQPRRQSTNTRASLKSSQAVITFKDSALFTPERKAFIRETITKFRDYLVKLDIPVPAETAPIGVSTGKNSSIERLSGATYRDNIMLGNQMLHDEALIRQAYSDFIIQEMLHTNQSNKGDLRVYRAGTIIATYYSLSFRNKKADHANDPWVPVLWSMRDRFGHEYMDNMIKFTLKVIRDEPSRSADTNFDTYFSRKIKDGNSVLDNNGGKRQEIDKLLKSSGLQISSED